MLLEEDQNTILQCYAPFMLVSGEKYYENQELGSKERLHMGQWQYDGNLDIDACIAQLKKRIDLWQF